MFTESYNEFNIRDVEIKLSRSMCYGYCPVYSLNLSGYGFLIYEGERYVEKIGQIKVDFPPEKIFKIIKKALEIGFFGMRDAYLGLEQIELREDGLVVHHFISHTDQPTYTVTIRIGNETKKVIDYQGAPDALREFEDYIDEMCDSYRWTGVR